jgi:hypothetical protein
MMTSTARNGLRAVVERAVLWMALLPLTCCGCVSLLGGKAPNPNDPPPPTVTACQVVAMWQPNVRFVPDPVRHGASNAGLAGRVYLYGAEEGVPVTGDGGLIVDLFDESNGQSVMLEEWNFDKDTLKKQLRKDPIGWGYTVFLPWGTYRPDISKVRLKVCYAPIRGNALYAEHASMTLHNAGPMPPDVAAATSMLRPAGPPPVVPPPAGAPAVAPTAMSTPMLHAVQALQPGR